MVVKHNERNYPLDKGANKRVASTGMINNATVLHRDNALRVQAKNI